MAKPTMTTLERLPAYRALTPAARRLYKQMTLEYQIQDTGGRRILLSGLRSLDLAEAAEAQLDADGAVLADRWGQKKAHPAWSVARDARAAWLASLRLLNLAVGDVPKRGRPGGDE